MPTHETQRQSQQTSQQQYTVPGAAEAAKMKQGLDSCVQSHPSISLVTSFAAGLVAGVAAGTLLAGSGQRSYYERSREFAESFGRQMFDSLNKAVPESVKPHHS